MDDCRFQLFCAVVKKESGPRDALFCALVVIELGTDHVFKPRLQNFHACLVSLVSHSCRIQGALMDMR